MDIYFAGSRNEPCDNHIIESSSDRLYSYYNDKRAIELWNTSNPKGKLFIDSGAFSAWTKGAKIDVDEYIKYINDRSDFVSLYGQIDAIGGEISRRATRDEQQEAARKTWENYLYMYPKMNKPEGLLYTFHIEEDYSFLENALEWKDVNGKQLEYMALGGMVGKPRPLKLQFIEKCFSIIHKSGNPNIKVHAFGMTSLKILETYPFFSADSTSWIMTGSMGGIMTRKGTVALSENRNKEMEHFTHLSSENQAEFEKIVLEYGFTLKELSEESNKRIIFNAKYMKKWSDEYELKSPLIFRKKLF